VQLSYSIFILLVTLGQVFRMNCENQALLAHVEYYPTVTMDVFALLMRQLDVLRGTSGLSEFRSFRLPTINFWNNLATINRHTQIDPPITSGAHQNHQQVAAG